MLRVYCLRASGFWALRVLEGLRAGLLSACEWELFFNVELGLAAKGIEAQLGRSELDRV